MPRVSPIDAKSAKGKTKELLAAVEEKFGMVPNILATLAHSPAALEAYLNFSGALGGAKLPADLRERIALAVAEANGCDYCLSAHTAIGRTVGLDDEAIIESRRGTGSEPRARAAVRFAQSMVEKRSWVGDEGMAELREAGFDDAEIIEMIAVVAANIFTNYFNHAAGTEIDFPRAPDLGAAGRGA